MTWRNQKLQRFGQRWGRSPWRAALFFLIGAIVLILFILPHSPNRASDQGPTLRFVTHTRAITQGIQIYARDHNFQLPSPEQLVSILDAQQLVSRDYFVLKEAVAGQSSFFYIPPVAEGLTINSQTPIVYSNPAIHPGGFAAVGFSDNHVEWLSPEQVRQFLADHAHRAFPLK